MEVFSVSKVVTAFCAFLSYYFCLAIYRLYISPFAKFPGRNLAALTLWYEFYFDVVKRGRYTWEIEKMHKEYGPIIRISPHELHINDPDYYEELYKGSTRRTEKYPWAAKQFGPSTSVFATVNHELHRIRRAPLAPFFSTKSVQLLEPAVQSVVDKLTSRLRDLQGTERVVNVNHMYCALTLDVISEYTFGRAYGVVDSPDFAAHWHQLVMDGSEMGHMNKQFGWLASSLRSLPQWLIKKMDLSLTAMFDVQDALQEQVVAVKADLEKGCKAGEQKNIFYDMLNNDQVRPEEKTTKHLVLEAVSIISGGMVTTSQILSTITYHLLQNPFMLDRLQGELASVMYSSDGKPSWQAIEKLPYLNAVISEGLRVGSGIPHRLARIAPDVDLEYKGWTIPPGTPVGMTSLLIHRNPDIFPQPMSFDPDRWLQQGQVGLNKYLVPFGKGTRQCLGMNLAYCEMYLTLATVFAPDRFNFELFDTTDSDAEVTHDFLNAVSSLESKGIRIQVK